MKISLSLVTLIVNCALFEAFHGALSIIGICASTIVLIASLSESLSKPAHKLRPPNTKAKVQKMNDQIQKNDVNFLQQAEAFQRQRQKDLDYFVACIQAQALCDLGSPDNYKGSLEEYAARAVVEWRHGRNMVSQTEMDRNYLALLAKLKKDTEDNKKATGRAKPPFKVEQDVWSRTTGNYLGIVTEVGTDFVRVIAWPCGTGTRYRFTEVTSEVQAIADLIARCADEVPK